jgi:copper resistance protein C
MNGRIVIALAIACLAAPAFAHAFLEHANPGAGATLKAAPRRVVLVFSEKLGPASTIDVSDAAGASIEAGSAVISGHSMVAPLRPVAPGRYRVMWHAVSPDAHRTEGAYSFTVQR